MKALIAGVVFVGVVGVGSVLGYSYFDDNKQADKTEEVEPAEVASASSEKEEPAIEAPTERTVETNGDMPWYYMTPEQITQATDNGQVAHLFSDAEEVEKYTVDLASNPDTTPYNKEDLADNWAKHIGAFIYCVKDYYPNELDYFMKLEEAKAAMASHEYDRVPGLIDEAKSLR
ncbi:hypothetical protein LCL96_12430 [Rossellomorea aquimaris]|uniref:hypothetical protein n=1 Tax=Rossellomorea aquimaris TaxID=189382 RepID=UPI001CD58E64|nr:hypothetical protein [Rossellomorea aquimaris]MCA1059754.1 hypothetical protein [Rossellomorea aquimaris]